MSRKFPIIPIASFILFNAMSIATGMDDALQHQHKKMRYPDQANIHLLDVRNAILNNEADALRKALESDAARKNINEPINLWDQEDTPLVLAARFGYNESIEILLAHGASIRTPGALHAAAAHNEIATCQFLLECGALVDACDNIYNSTPLHEAARAGHVRICKLLLRKGAHIDARTIHSNSPPELCAAGGHIACSELFFKFKPDLYQQDLGSLIAAARNGHHATVHFLLTHGSTSNSRYRMVLPILLNALQQACCKTKIPVIMQLILDNGPVLFDHIYGASLEATDSSHETALSHALEFPHSNMETIYLLLYRGATLPSKLQTVPSELSFYQLLETETTRNLSTPYHRLGRLHPMLQDFLQGPRFFRLSIYLPILQPLGTPDNIECIKKWRTIYGRWYNMALVIATYHGHIQLVDTLLRYGADPINPTSLVTYNPLIIASCMLAQHKDNPIRRRILDILAQDALLRVIQLRHLADPQRNIALPLDIIEEIIILYFSEHLMIRYDQRIKQALRDAFLFFLSSEPARHIPRAENHATIRSRISS